MTQTKTCVTIKGTKDGLTFLLDDRCSFDSLIVELKEKLSSSYYKGSDNDPSVRVKVDVGARYLDSRDKEELENIITNERNLAIEQFDTSVVSKEEAQHYSQEAETTTLTRMVRSGQVVKVRGDALLVGDINPGGLLMATGNIFVMGALKGRAHAGCEGNEKVFISASLMAPSQLQIADVFLVFADIEHEEAFMEAAFLDTEQRELRLERIQRLMDARPELKEAEEPVTVER
ncbi:septum site-determining protein MinC [Shouchella shacheensis]|uniref:septum site-determining protein MinC n=1 Tax=Shouchella shacheensis TaxID=1649580 RepID=UPI00073FC25A|nr:septum site-determining protein MinC [Shouchella shacheensis]